MEGLEEMSQDSDTESSLLQNVRNLFEEMEERHRQQIRELEKKIISSSSQQSISRQSQSRSGYGTGGSQGANLRATRINKGAIRKDTRTKAATSRSGKPKQNTKKMDVHCQTCGKPGHLAKICFKSRRTCYNCDKKGHIASECPEPRSERLANAQTANEMRRAQSWDMRRNKPPELLKMKLGNAKLLATWFEMEKDAIFHIIGNQKGPDESDVWVAIGQNERQNPDVARFLRESQEEDLHTSEETWQ